MLDKLTYITGIFNTSKFVSIITKVKNMNELQVLKDYINQCNIYAWLIILGIHFQ